jgi:hypothetical protein
VARRIRSIAKSSNLTGNRSSDYLACSIVPQQTKLPRAPLNIGVRIILKLFIDKMVWYGLD